MLRCRNRRLPRRCDAPFSPCSSVPSAPPPGTLHLVATPIGNLEDITYRAVRTLAEADLIAAEDTRRTARLLAHYGISTRCVSFHEHNEARKTGVLLDHLARGDRIALVSDAGTPLVSDPGRRLVRAALDSAIRVEAIPGPSAILTALVASGLATDSFTFAGFPPSRSNARKKWFARLEDEARPVVFFEAPHRIRASLTDLQSCLGDRTIAICREMTKLHENYVVCPISEALASTLGTPRGEYTLIVAPPPPRQASAELPAEAVLVAEFGHLTEIDGLGRRAAIRTLATRYGVSGRAVYGALETGRGYHPGEER
ncbi:MAG: 16S rRNA (cytidine(1402)-2'-O)-methyltransferase [Acidobacteria bacterium]|nr:16S rRNA (cytidine(1402)-2'-O)-methyltransferase [Acidobacteriota bacterium]MYJ03890.1 16S rRNA (cytidine(1402)-2'-O)-methyltransferase [Acidobacteriota bacterium]